MKENFPFTHEYLKDHVANDELSPDELALLLELFPKLLKLFLEKDRPTPALEDSFRSGFSELEPTEWQDFLRPLRNGTLADLISALPIWDNSQGRPNRKLALELADTLGAENAQRLYRFAVLVTKLA